MVITRRLSSPLIFSRRFTENEQIEKAKGGWINLMMRLPGRVTIDRLTRHPIRSLGPNNITKIGSLPPPHPQIRSVVLLLPQLRAGCVVEQSQEERYNA